MAAAVAAVGLFGSAASAQIVYTFEAPGVQTSQVPATQSTQDFNITTGTNYGRGGGQGVPLLLAPGGVGAPAGTYTTSSNQNGVSVVVADQFGGAGGNTNYLLIGASAASAFLRLDLLAPAGYFGMWWSAVDMNNRVRLYNGNTLLFETTGADLYANAPLTGAPGSTNGHYSNPNSAFGGQNTNEAYLYVNFFATTVGSQFDRIEWDQIGGTGQSGYEMDNHTLISGLQTVRGTAVPEPMTVLGVAALGLAAAGAARRRARR
jgi:hypothetical protein